MATLSVILAVGRQEEALDCIRSLLESELPEGDYLEIVAATEDPQKLAAQFTDPRLKTVSSNAGAAGKRNTAAAQAQGEFFAFLDDDALASTHWAACMLRHLRENPNALVSGPNFDKRTDWPHRLANELQSFKYAEGLFSHRPMTEENREVKFNAIILANLGCTREVFEHIGGFNDKADHYMDDTEFAYIASRLGCRFLFFRDLEVQHAVRPLVWPFYRRQNRARFHAGMNLIVYPECYLGAKQVKLYLFSWVVLAAYALAFLVFPLKTSCTLALAAIAAYVLFMLYVAFHYGRKRDWLAVPVMPVAVLATHANAWLSYGCGIAYGIYARLIRHRHAVKHKSSRYSTFAGADKGEA